MVTLNRFPLLGLWAREAAHRIGYVDREADVIGHAYAVLYAIRANSPTPPVSYKDEEAAKSAKEALESSSDIETLSFGGDELEVSRNGRGELVGRVGNQLPQTAESYRYKVMRKFPDGYYPRVQAAFRDFLAAIDPKKLDSRMVYGLYDQWKKACASGRMVDLDRLIKWCHDRKPAAAKA
jgi:hypothetical protein